MIYLISQIKVTIRNPGSHQKRVLEVRLSIGKAFVLVTYDLLPTVKKNTLHSRPSTCEGT